MQLNDRIEPRVIVALDYASLDATRLLVKQLSPKRCRLKVGSILFTVAGPDFVSELIEQGFDVFLDLKFHDIPHTVFHAVEAVAKLGVWMLTVHIAGGKAMLAAAVEAVNQGVHKPFLVGVSVLTSLLAHDFKEVGYDDADMGALVLKRAQLAEQVGLDGVVCSGQEVALLREQFSNRLCLVTPGIRLQTGADDQQRTLTPKQAIEAGSDFLVIGRPITGSAAPAKALENIYRAIATS